MEDQYANSALKDTIYSMGSADLLKKVVRMIPREIANASLALPSRVVSAKSLAALPITGNSASLANLPSSSTLSLASAKFLTASCTTGKDAVSVRMVGLSTTMPASKVILSAYNIVRIELVRSAKKASS